MISTRDFYGQEFYAFCQRQYDEARNFLKNCGKPNDEIDRFLIETNKFTARTFGRLLDNTQAIKEIQARKALANAEQEQWKTCRHCGFDYKPPKKDKWFPLEQTEQEPDYFALTKDHTWISVTKKQYDDIKDSGHKMACYSAPPQKQWVGLTDDETMILANETSGQHWMEEAHIQRFRAAIEAKLKEKNT
jgi:hypothetical protein